MLQPGGDLDLTQEPVSSERRRQIGPQHLHRHPAVVLEITGEIHRGHAAAADLSLDGISLGQGGLQSVYGARHGRASWDSAAKVRIKDSGSQEQPNFHAFCKRRSLHTAGRMRTL
jgi:hypothetical protein